MANFYPRPPRGGRLKSLIDSFLPFGISIHALREEGDAIAWHKCHEEGISIHALREEGDLIEGQEHPELFQFLSTPSARRATGTKALA